MTRQSEKTPETPGEQLFRLIITTILSLVFIMFVEWRWPEVIPFTLTQFLYFDGSLGEVLRYAIPIFIFGVAVTLSVSLFTRNRPEQNRIAELIAPIGCLNSTFAGVFEELVFRWIVFYTQIVVYFLLNQLFFTHWGGFGAFEWWHVHITAPLTNFILGLGVFNSLNFDVIQPIISGETYGWYVGAALVTSVGKFRDEHTGHGIVGKAVVWFIGMFMFVIMFQYGLFAAMLVHFLYDLLIYLVIAADSMVEKKRGFV